MNLDQLKLDIEEREVLLKKLDRSNPLYPIMENTLLGIRERYELLRKSEEKEGRRYDKGNR